jgi:hypothetical protein
LHVSFSLGVSGSLGRSLGLMDLVNRGWSTNFAESNCSLGCKIENITLDSILLQLSLEKKRKGQLSFAVGGLTTSCIQADWTIIQCKCMQMKQRKPIVQAGDTVYVLA